jgi:deoxyribodipyrimidine photolyase-related protein
MKEMKMEKTLRLILGDQINENHSWFTSVDPTVTYLLVETRSETDYVRHHIQKVAGFFAAMRYFAHLLTEKGHQVEYVKISDEASFPTFGAAVQSVIGRFDFQYFEYQEPDEYRVDQHLNALKNTLSIPVRMVSSEHFFTTRTDVSRFFEGKKTRVMERFYRHLRTKEMLLMDGDKPWMNQWNFDAENRKKIPAKHVVPEPFLFRNNVVAIVDEIQNAGIKTIGVIDANNYIWPISRQQSLQLLEAFVKDFLPFFGTFEDAMSKEHWSIYHARISFSLNTKMVSPREVIARAIQEWEKRPTEISYNQLEGFVRQILGWREFMRGVYWAKMPEFASMNFLEHTNPVPDWYWTGETNMNCMKHAIKQSLDHAYAHHIQRLMVIGNFSLLANIHPDELDQWYLGIYIDAIEWVEITNTRGMSQFADGGIIGTKPYVCSASYMHKMSNYCQGCFYDKDKKTGEKACPLNSMYWYFHEKHAEKLASNPRIGMVYTTLKKMDPEKKEALIKQAKLYINEIHSL